MDFLKFLYDIICFIVLAMGCSSIYDLLQERARKEYERDIPQKTRKRVQYFFIFLTVLLFLLFVSITHRMFGPTDWSHG